jgi:hypothetical protein
MAVDVPDDFPGENPPRAARLRLPEGWCRSSAGRQPPLIERDPDAFFLAPNYCAGMDFVFRMNNQCELVRDADLRTNVERRAGWRQIAKHAGDCNVAKAD